MLRLRIAFLMTATVVLAQIVFTQVVIEPYPGFGMPAFGGVPDSAVVPSLVAVTDGGRGINVDYRRIFDTDQTHNASFMVDLYRPGGSRRRLHEFVDGLRQDLGMRPLPGHDTLVTDPSARSWLADRIRDAYPDHEPSAAVFTWTRVTFDLSPAAAVHEGRPLHVVRVEFEPSARGH